MNSCDLFRNGQVYSYCGISDSEVCCFINHNNTTKDYKSTKVIRIRNEFSESVMTAISNESDDDNNNRFTSITDQTTTVTLLDPGFEIDDRIMNCGIPEIPVQINSNARFQEWPWHVRI
jgi:hypothetical protein